MHRSWLCVVLLGGVIPTRLPAQLISNPDSSWGSLRAAILATSPELSARRLGVAVAGARIRSTGHVPPAELSGELEEGGRSVRLDLSRNLLDRSRDAARAIAEAESLRVAADLDAAERRVAIEGERTLVRAAIEHAVATRLAAADSLLAAAEEALRTRFAVGAARYADVLRLRAERLRIQAERIARESRAATTRRALVGLLHDSLRARLAPAADAAILRLASDTAPRVLPDPPGADTAIAAWGLVRRAETTVASANAGLVAARATRTPSLSASLGIQRFDADGGHRIGPTVGAVLSLPFTSTGPRRGVTLAQLEIRRAEAERDATLSGARILAGAAMARYRTAREQMSIYDTALLRGARDEREAALAAFRTGEVSLLELLDFELALTRAEISRVETWAEAIDALSELLVGNRDSHEPAHEETAR